MSQDPYAPSSSSEFDRLGGRGEDMSATPDRLWAASESLQRFNDALRLIGGLDAEPIGPVSGSDLERSSAKA